MLTQERADSRKLDPVEFVELLGEWSVKDGPLYRQLADAIAELVSAGALRAGHQLPPERGVAAALNVSRGTVVRAYDSLSELGAIERVQGSGTTVRGHRLGVASGPAFIGSRLWSQGPGQAVDLLKAIPSVLEPTLEIVAGTDLFSLGADIDSAEPLGVWPLRVKIAEWYCAQGLETTPHQVMVTSGAQQALMVAIHALVRPGDVVLGEDDTWPGLIDIVRQLGGRFQQIKMDDQGIIIDDLERLLQRYAPALVALNPQFQNPTGTCLPPERVARVAELVDEYGVPLIEDRVAASLAFDGRDRPPIASYPCGGQAMIADSLSKVAWPGARIGWLRAEAQLIRRFRSTKAINDMFTSLLGQALGLGLIDRYDELVAARVAQLRPRADTVVEAVRQELPDWTFTAPRGGLSLWTRLPHGAAGEAFVQHAASHGVLLASCLSFSFCDPPVGGTHLRIPFTAPEPALIEGIRRAGEAWRSFDPTKSAAKVF